MILRILLHTESSSKDQKFKYRFRGSRESLRQSSLKNERTFFEWELLSLLPSLLASPSSLNFENVTMTAKGGNIQSLKYVIRWMEQSNKQPNGPKIMQQCLTISKHSKLTHRPFRFVTFLLSLITLQHFPVAPFNPFNNLKLPSQEANTTTQPNQHNKRNYHLSVISADPPYIF